MVLSTLLLVAAAGCFADPAQSPPPPGASAAFVDLSSKRPVASTRLECESLDGRWLEPSAFCSHVGTGDAGKACTDSSECESYCRTTTLVEPCIPVQGSCHESYDFEECTQGVASGLSEYAFCS